MLSLLGMLILASRACMSLIVITLLTISSSAAPNAANFATLREIEGESGPFYASGQMIDSFE